MKKLILLLLSVFIFSCSSNKKSSKNYTILFEKSNGTETDTYENVIKFYKNLANDFQKITLFEIGKTDSGEPLHLVVFNAEGKISKNDLKTSKKNRILINNGIHPGESDGIDATMMLFRDILKSDSLQKKYKNSLICGIAVHNIGGALNRNSHTRTNQNGPKEYGFRGNARNFDLNRDFIKLDTENAKAFTQIFQLINPDVFIDNHTSNGADYQYAITHLLTQHNKLGGDLGNFLETEMRPQLEESLSKKGIDITPYVTVWGKTPDEGWTQFLDSPRYSTGYAALFNTLGLMVETHMLKPYKIRVEQTYELMFSMLDFAEKNTTKIKKLRANANAEFLKRKTYPIAFSLDQEKPTIINFKGYEGKMIDSKVTNGKRLFYDRTKPYTKPVNYYNNFKVTKEVAIPKAYILHKGWHKVIKALQLNNIKFTRFKKDTLVTVEVSHIKEYKTRTTTYEGHYLHYDTSVKKSTESIQFKKGDLYIPTNQKGLRYLIETLEAEATDSFFNWNFFDTILQQKEWFSSYVFEDIAEEFLNKNPLIKEKLEEKIKTDKAFSENTWEQLYWVYKHTKHYEKEHMRLPVFKVLH